MESHTRTILKTLSWRLLATLATIGLVYTFIHQLDIAAAVGGIEVVLKLALYYLHERLWNRVKNGKKTTEAFVLWFTGLSGSGKSTLAGLTYDYLKKNGLKIESLDGDVVREVFPQTGFSKEERNAHVKRVGFLASLLEKNGTSVVASLISPYQEARDFVRSRCNNFVEIFVDTPLEECEKRDVKGLYKDARAGKIKNFTGIDDPYEDPVKPEIHIKTDGKSPEESLEEIKRAIKKYF